MKKILYLDRPFKSALGGDKNRSRYLFEVLGQNLLVEFCSIEAGNVDPVENAALTLKGEGFKSPFLPQSIVGFSKKEKDLVCSYISENKIDGLFVRTISFTEIAVYVSLKLPQVKIFIDVDLLFSRLMAQSWKMGFSIKRRFYLVEWIKLARYEANLFKQNFTFLLANEVEVLDTRNRFPDSKIEYLPNTTDLDIMAPGVGEAHQVVFFGAMDSTANFEGYNYIHNKLFPLIKDVLEKNSVDIIIAGKGCEKLFPSEHRHIRIIGKVDSIAEVILASRFVILPIFVASGTNTRVIEAAMCGRAVLVTPLAMEGLADTESREYVADSLQQMAQLFIKMLEDEILTRDLAIQLQNSITKNFSFESFVDKLCRIISG